MNTAIARGLRHLRVAGAIRQGDALGCKPSDIDRIESDLAVKLPSVYKEFLSTLGRGAGTFLSGSDFNYADLPRINSEARDLAHDAGIDLPTSAFVFLIHQGYQFLWFDTSEGADPEVRRFREGEPGERLGRPFSAWFLNEADYHIRVMRSLGRSGD